MRISREKSFNFISLASSISLTHSFSHSCISSNMKIKIHFDVHFVWRAREEKLWRAQLQFDVCDLWLQFMSAVFIQRTIDDQVINNLKKSLITEGFKPFKILIEFLFFLFFFVIKRNYKIFKWSLTYAAINPHIFDWENYDINVNWWHWMQI